jgi:PAS domain-containing protein
MVMNMVSSPGLNPNTLAFFELLVGSYQKFVGKKLVKKEQGPEWLYGDAPFVVLAHNTAPDPVFIYANATAQRLFGYSRSEFTTLHSRLSAGPMERAERQALLDGVTRDGFVADYRGLRVKKTGERFWIEDGVIWQLRDKHGGVHGQAATFSRWTQVGN